MSCEADQGRIERPGGSHEGAGTEVRDSAGIRIVESRTSAWAPGEEWTIAPSPSLEVGVESGQPEYEFASIWAATRHPDGRIAIVDGGAAEVRIFGADGRHLRTFGGRGDGPGEFQEGPFVRWAGGDTLITWDPRALRLSWFDGEGTVVRDRSLASLLMEHPVPTARGSPTAWYLSPEGGLLAVGFALDIEADRRHFGYPLHLVLPGWDTVFALGSHGVQEAIVTEEGLGVPNPFAAWVRPAVRWDPPTVFVGGLGRSEIAALNPEGSVARLLRPAIPRASVTERMIEGHRDLWRARADSTDVSPAPFLAALAQFEVPDSLPPFWALHTDESGNLWAARRARLEQGREVDLEVLDPEGTWLGTVRLPDGVHRILEIGSEYLLALSRDELGVHRMRMHRVRK